MTTLTFERLYVNIHTHTDPGLFIPFNLLINLTNSYHMKKKAL